MNRPSKIIFAGPRGPKGAKGDKGSGGFSDAIALASDIGAHVDDDDCAAAIQAAMDGGLMELIIDGVYRCGALRLTNGFKLDGITPRKSVLKPVASLAVTDTFIANKDFSLVSGDRIAQDIYIGNFTIDGALRSPTWAKWLSKLDGTAITNPEADYVMGSGALASGVGGVSLTAVLSGDGVASVTVNNPGAGFAAHPTVPYIPTTVALLFTGGGGVGAAGYVPISAGAISGPAVITSPGHSYTSPPAVTTLGGYADVALLVTPSVNRRNPNFNNIGPAIKLDCVDRPLVENLVFVDYANRCLTDTGCRDLMVRRCDVIRCGKDDGAFMPFWSQARGNPAAPDATYQDSENTIFDTCSFFDLERLAILFAPTKGGAILNLKINNAKEGGIFIPATAAVNGGRVRIIGGEIKGIRRPEISGHAIELRQPLHTEISGLLIEDTEGYAFAAAGLIDSSIHDCVTLNCGARNGTYLFRPETERYTFAAGTRPLCGTQYSHDAVVQVGYDGGLANKNTFFHHNIIRETRSDHPPSVFRQVRAGTTPDPLTQRLVVESNIIDVPADMAAWNSDLTGIFETASDKIIRDNIGGDRFRRREDDSGNYIVERVSGSGIQVLANAFVRSDMKSMLSTLGLGLNLTCCLDAGAAASYDGTSQTWFDLTANDNDYYRGAGVGAGADDPTFVGSSGAIDDLTYFSGDGGDYFTPVGTPTFGANWHKAGAKFTVVMIVQIGGTGGSIFSTFNTGGTGIVLAPTSGLLPNFQVFNAGVAVMARANPQALSTTQLVYYAISVDEAAEVGSLVSVTQVGTSQKKFDGTYAAPSSGAASGKFTIWARPALSFIMPTGVKLAALAVWEGRALTAQELSTLRAGLLLRWPGI